LASVAPSLAYSILSSLARAHSLSSGIFFLYRSGDPRDLHSFPTRRSSDLLYLGFGSYTDGGGGWLVAVDTGKSSGTPRLASAFTGGPWTGTTANSGMWGDGGAAIGPNGVVYVTTGHGPAGPVGNYWGEALLAFAPSLP